MVTRSYFCIHPHWQIYSPFQLFTQMEGKFWLAATTTIFINSHLRQVTEDRHVHHRLLKVPITPKYFFRLNNSLHLFETHCAFLHLFSPNLDFLQAVKVTKSDHNLFHDRASKGLGLFLG